MALYATSQPEAAYEAETAAENTHKRGPRFGSIGVGRLTTDTPEAAVVLAAAVALAGLRFDGSPFPNGTPGPVSYSALRRETGLGRDAVRAAVLMLQQLGHLDDQMQPDAQAVAERWRTGRRCYFPRGLRSSGLSALAMVLAAGHVHRDGRAYVSRWTGSGRFLEALRLGLPEDQAHKTKRALLALQRAGCITKRRDPSGATLRRLTDKALSTAVQQVESDPATVSKADTGACRKRTPPHVESGHAERDVQMDQERDYPAVSQRRPLAVVVHRPERESGRSAPDNPIPLASSGQSGDPIAPWMALQDAETAARTAIAGGWSSWWTLLQDVHRQVYNAARDDAAAWNRTLIAAGVHLPPSFYTPAGRRGMAQKRRQLAEECQRLGEPTLAVAWLFVEGERLQRQGGQPSELGPLLAVSVREKGEDYIRRSKQRVADGLGPLPLDCELAQVAQIEKKLPLGQQVVPQSWVEQAQTPQQAATLAGVIDMVATVAAPKTTNQVAERKQVDHRQQQLLRMIAEPMRRCIAKRDQAAARAIWQAIAKQQLNVDAADLAPYCGTTPEALLLLVAEPVESANVG